MRCCISQCISDLTKKVQYIVNKNNVSSETPLTNYRQHTPIASFTPCVLLNDPCVSSHCVDQSDVSLQWVSPQLMLTSVVMVMGSPCKPPPHTHLRPLLLCRQLIWVRNETPLRSQQSRKNKQPEEEMEICPGI